MKKIIVLLTFCLALFGADATTSIVNKGTALPKIVVQDASNLPTPDLANKFFKLMVGDLMVGATFEVSSEYFTSSYDGDFRTNIGAGAAQLIVRYAYNGGTNLNVKVLNAKNGTIMFEKSYSISDSSRYPFLAHAAVSEIVKNLGYANVDWMNKMIIFSRETGVRQSQILVSDYTLSYQKVIVSGGMNIFPKWANSEQNSFYYTTFVNMTPTLYRYNLKDGSRSKILSGNGMLVCSDVSEDGTRLVLTMAPHDQPDIYVYSLGSRNLTRITDYSGIDVSGNFVDGDTKVVFVSDRLGYPNIFAKSTNSGSGVEQMVFHGRNNSALGTYKNYIVYSSREAPGVFNLYLISTQTDYIRQLTSGGENLFPRFSSDGGSIVFIKYSSMGSSLGIIRVNENKSFQFPLNLGKIQSLDW